MGDHPSLKQEVEAATTQCEIHVRRVYQKLDQWVLCVNVEKLHSSRQRERDAVLFPSNMVTYSEACAIVSIEQDGDRVYQSNSGGGSDPALGSKSFGLGRMIIRFMANVGFVAEPDVHRVRPMFAGEFLPGDRFLTI